MISLDKKAQSRKCPDCPFEISSHFDSKCPPVYLGLEPPQRHWLWRTMGAKYSGRAVKFLGDALDGLRGREGD